MHSKGDWDRESPFRVEFKIRALVMTLKDENRNASLEMLVLRAEGFFWRLQLRRFHKLSWQELNIAHKSP
jgi:hypothetical protein